MGALRWRFGVSTPDLINATCAAEQFSSCRSLVLGLTGNLNIYRLHRRRLVFCALAVTVVDTDHSFYRSFFQTLIRFGESPGNNTELAIILSTSRDCVPDGQLYAVAKKARHQKKSTLTFPQGGLSGFRIPGHFGGMATFLLPGASAFPG